MKKLLFLIFYLLIGCVLTASEFKYHSILDSIPNNGYYRILLIPEVISGLKGDYSDIRLYDSVNNEIPFLLTKESSIRSNTYFNEYKILSNQNLTKPAVNQVIVQNPLASSITELYIVVRNSDIEKEITVKGSDNLKNWFIISQQNPSTIGLFQDEACEIKVLNFPKSNYKYFMLQMSIKTEEPLQILKAGRYDIRQEKGLFSEVPVMSVIQSDSSKYKKSFITVRFKSSFEISKIEFKVKGPAIYQRNFVLNNRVSSYKGMADEYVGQFIMSAKAPLVYEVNTLRTSELRIIINNDDNIPLKITNVKCYQLNVYLIAQLKGNMKYRLRFGNPNLEQPNYDLKYYTDSIPKNLAVLRPGIPEQIKAEQQKSIVHSFFNSRIIWIVLILIIGLLGYMTLKLTKEIK
jgi:hypothetical protein